MPTILECIVTTLNADGTVNVAPMGPEVDDSMDRVVLKPFKTSTTYANVSRTRTAVVNVTDDVLLLAQAAVGALKTLPETRACPGAEGAMLADACRWYALRCDHIDDRDDRVRIDTRVVARGRLRDFFGFSRAKHAVVEAAILATRVHMIPPEDLANQLSTLEPLIAKTGSSREHEAFALLQKYTQHYAIAHKGGGR
ncbi:MAG: DUF447 domain-containing protein [Planctomycetota bacterium]